MISISNTERIRLYTKQNIRNIVEEVDNTKGFKKYIKTLTVRQKNGVITKWFGNRSRLIFFQDHLVIPYNSTTLVYDIYALTKDEIGIAKYTIGESNEIFNLELHVMMIKRKPVLCDIMCVQ